LDTSFGSPGTMPGLGVVERPRRSGFETVFLGGECVAKVNRMRQSF